MRKLIKLQDETVNAVFTISFADNFWCVRLSNGSFFLGKKLNESVIKAINYIKQNRIKNYIVFKNAKPYRLKKENK
jgi:hypothetical protein